MPFEPGVAIISPAGEERLQALAKALANRPAVNLEINGWADPVADLDRLKRASIERKVRALKRSDLQARGQAADYGAVTVSEQEYPALLARIYHEEKFEKPRNLIGLEKRLPVAEMEQLIIAHTEITDDDLRALADRRARAVRDWLIKMGHVPGERLFLLAPDVGKVEGKTEGTSFSKVEFALK
jgi:hypothetical protein